jgi:hypothetical protein
MCDAMQNHDPTITTFKPLHFRGNHEPYERGVRVVIHLFVEFVCCLSAYSSAGFLLNTVRLGIEPGIPAFVISLHAKNARESRKITNYLFRPVHACPNPIIMFFMHVASS